MRHAIKCASSVLLCAFVLAGCDVAPVDNEEPASRSAPALQREDLPRPSEVRRECIATCREKGNTASACKPLCSGGPGYICKPIDNSFDHNLCRAAINAWYWACNVETGTFLEALCALAAKKAVEDCPAKTICI